MSAFRIRRLRRSSRGADRQAILTRANRSKAHKVEDDAMNRLQWLTKRETSPNSACSTWYQTCVRRIA